MGDNMQNEITEQDIQILKKLTENITRALQKQGIKQNLIDFIRETLETELDNTSCMIREKEIKQNEQIHETANPKTIHEATERLSEALQDIND